jgi:hypothetical protein
MRAKLIAITAAGFFIGSSSALLAESSTVAKTPGHEMQEKGSVKGQPGASGYAPGHEMQEKGSKPGHPGASGYAPGREAKGTADRDRDDATRRR